MVRLGNLAPPFCGERSEFAEGEFRVRGKAIHSLHAQHSQERSPLTPTLSPQERGEGE